jgi:allantoinase
MASTSVVITGDNVWLNAQQSEPLTATIEISASTGKILGVFRERRERSAYGNGVEWIDAGNAVVMPGIVDAHVN